MQHEIGEHGTLSRATERNPLPTRPRLERAEHEKLNGVAPHGEVRRRYSPAERKYRARG